MKAQLNTYDMVREPLYKKVPLDTPYGINIEPSAHCNLRCNYCIHSLPYQELKTRDIGVGLMEWDVFEMFVDQTAKFPQKVKKIAFSGLGEPLLHKRIPDMVQLIKQKDIADKVLLNTNAVLLNKELIDDLLDTGLDEVKISLQGVTSEKYKKLCGADIDYSELYENIAYLSKHKKSCLLKVKVPMVALDDGEKEIFESQYGDICDFIGYENIFAQFTDVSYTDDIKENKSTNRYRREYRRLRVCPFPFYRCNLRYNGRVTLCMPANVMPDDKHIQDVPLPDIWNGETRNKLMLDHLNGKRQSMKPCAYCNDPENCSHPDDEMDGYEDVVINKLCNKCRIIKNII